MNGESKDQRKSKSTNQKRIMKRFDCQVGDLSLQINTLERLYDQVAVRFMNHTKIEIGSISEKDYNKTVKVPPSNEDAILENMRLELAVTSNLLNNSIIDRQIIFNKMKANVDVSSNVSMLINHLCQAFFHMGIAWGFHSLMFAHEEGKEIGVSEDQAARAKRKNEKEKEWVIREYDLMTKKPCPEVEEYYRAGKFNKSAFARKYSELVKFQFDLSGDKIVPETILKWIKDYEDGKYTLPAN